MKSPGQEADPHRSETRCKSRNSDRESSPTIICNPYFTGRPRTPTNAVKLDVVDRQQIIRKIKEKGLARQRLKEANSIAGPYERLDEEPTDQTSNPSSLVLTSPQLRVPSKQAGEQPKKEDDWTAHGLEISRPRSALHRGDFSGRDVADSRPSVVGRSPIQDDSYAHECLEASSPPAPWHDRYTQRPLHHPIFSRNGVQPLAAAARPRAASHVSLSRSFTYQTPSSPLVHQANAEDSSDGDGAPRPGAVAHLDRFSRRRTFSPRSLQAFSQMLNAGSDGQFSASPPALRREGIFPYQAHQPRRSITSVNCLPPQTPGASTRRLSGFGSSPLQSAMVGSFEESILRGRMSSTPSKPLDFTAHVGVLGMGDCRPSLKCPPHMTVPFPAVYYNYGTNGNDKDPQPSPYVGLVDLENSTHARDIHRKGRPRPDITGRRSHPQSRDGSPAPVRDVSEETTSLSRRRKQKQRGRSRSRSEEPKGAYRIPPKGQLQIIIKNPNKTAVKLFLVPYDVSDIQPGQKTFIRQRSYSAGPIIEMPIDARKNLGTDRPEAAISNSDDPRDRPVLRYLIHLHICCTSKSRIWLYKSVRVVFANRVPDGKEKLRNEIQLPDPRYSTYKAARSSGAPDHPGGSRVDGVVQMDIDGLDQRPMPAPQPKPFPNSLPSTTSESECDFSHRVTERCFRFPLLETVASRPASRGVPDDTTQQGYFGEALQRVRSPPKSPFLPLSPMQRAISLTTDTSEGTGSITFSRTGSTDKLQGVGNESLLSKRLRDLGMSRTASPVNGNQIDHGAS